MIDFFVSLLLGIALGFVAGLVPGLHPNLLGVLFVSSFLDQNTIIVLVAMLVSSSFFEFLRSVFLFVPDEGQVLAMHPIFKFVNEGKGQVAIRLLCFGLLLAIFISIIISPLLILIVPPVFLFIKDYVPFILLIVAAALIVRDAKPFAAVTIFICAGVIGYFGLSSLNQPLLILLTGFFGFPVLFKMQKHAAKQIKLGGYSVPFSSSIRGITSAFVSSLMLTFVPAVGPAQSSVFTRSLLKKSEDFLLSIGAIAGFDIVFSLVLLYSVGRARIGILEVAGNYFNFDLHMLIVSLLVALGVAAFSYFITLKLSSFAAENIAKIDYRLLGFAVVFGITLASFYFDGISGILFLFLAAGIGSLADRLGTSMTHCMGSLMIPVLLYYFI
jgi:putative membrane protein